MWTCADSLSKPPHYQKPKNAHWHNTNFSTRAHLQALTNSSKKPAKTIDKPMQEKPLKKIVTRDKKSKTIKLQLFKNRAPYNFISPQL